MSIAVYGVVWRLSETTGGHRLVMLALADHADDDGLCWPSVATIADLVRRGELLVAVRVVRGGYVQPRSLAYLDRAVSEALTASHADTIAEDVHDAHLVRPRSSFRASNREAIADAIARRLGAGPSTGAVLGALSPLPG